MSRRSYSTPNGPPGANPWPPTPMPQQPQPQPRACACGCPRKIPASAHARRIYFDDACRTRVRRRRLKAAMKAAGLPELLSIENLQMYSKTHPPGRHAENGSSARESKVRARRAGVSVYLPSIEAAEALAAAVRDLDGLELQTAALDRAIQRRTATRARQAG